MQCQPPFGAYLPYDNQAPAPSLSFDSPFSTVIVSTLRIVDVHPFRLTRVWPQDIDGWPGGELRTLLLRCGRHRGLRR